MASSRCTLVGVTSAAHVWVKAETERAERTVTVWEDYNSHWRCRDHVDGVACVMEQAYGIAVRESRAAEAEAMTEITDRDIWEAM